MSFERTLSAADIEAMTLDGYNAKSRQSIYDPDPKDDFPALELKRRFYRQVPRGFRVGPHRVLVPVPGDDWPSRWQAAVQDCGDMRALSCYVNTGRMIALKVSPVWQSLSAGAGGYQDATGSGEPPFAFNSGFGTFAVSRPAAIVYGLITPAEHVDATSIVMKRGLTVSAADQARLLQSRKLTAALRRPTHLNAPKPRRVGGVGYVIQLQPPNKAKGAWLK